MKSYVGDKAGSIGVLFLGIVLFLALVGKLSPFIPDDSYISFRYSENLAAGNGLAFNPGEAPVEGYSNFFWVLVCAVPARLGLELERAAEALGVLFGVLSIVVLWMIIRRVHRSVDAVVMPILLLSSSAPFVLYSLSGLWGSPEAYRCGPIAATGRLVSHDIPLDDAQVASFPSGSVLQWRFQR